MEEDFLKSLAEGFEFFAVLSNDLDYSIKQLKDYDSQTTRRIYVRSFFAFIEGNSFRQRQIALEAHKRRSSCFSIEEVIMLEEKDVFIQENGNIKIRTKYIDQISNIRFSQNCIVKATGAKEPDYTDNRWNQLRKAVEIRNRITHPRCKEDFDINDNDLEIINEAKQWYSDNIQFLF